MQYAEFARQLLAVLATTPDDGGSRYSVYQEFVDGVGEQTRHGVSYKEALRTAIQRSTSETAKAGITQRVLITEEGKHCVFEWTLTEGLTWPPLETLLPELREEVTL